MSLQLLFNFPKSNNLFVSTDTAIVVPFASESPLLLTTVNLCLLPQFVRVVAHGASAFARRILRRELITRGRTISNSAPRIINLCLRGIRLRRSDLFRETDLTRSDLVRIRRISLSLIRRI